MKKDISIHIPEPCHEDWQQMTPVDKGRFCQSCAKQVVDFSLMTDQQVLNYLANANGRLCGRFAADQLQRSLQPLKQKKKKMWWMAAVLPLMMLVEKAGAQKKTNKHTHAENIIKLTESAHSLGIVVFSSNPSSNYINEEAENTPAENDKYNFSDTAAVDAKITVWRKIGQSNFVVAGKIEDAKNNEPISYATILIKGTKNGTIADEHGNFKLNGNSTDNNFTLVVSATGFSVTEKEVILKDTEEVQNATSYQIHGQVVDMEGNAIPFASVKTNYEKQKILVGQDGRFVLTLPAKHPDAFLTISAIGFEEKQVFVSKSDTAEMIIKCDIASTTGLTQVVVVSGKTFYCDKVKKTDTIPAFIRAIFHAEQFKIYPNPAQRGQPITIDTKKVGEYSIQLFDNSGKLLQVKEFDAVEGATKTPFTIPSLLAPGMYYIRLIDNKSKKQYTDKIIIQ